MRNTNLPKRCLNTTNTSHSGARITSRWLSAWWERNEAPAAPKASAICGLRSIRNSFRSFGKRGLISAQSITIKDVRLRSRMSKDIQYVTDVNGKRIAIILPIEDYENLLEDLNVIAAAYETRNEAIRPLEDVIADWRAAGEIDI